MVRTKVIYSLVVGIGGVGAVLGVGSVLGRAPNQAFSLVSAAATSTSTTVATVAPTYPVNSQGETYGSAANAPSPSQLPDLIRVRADNGQIGYITRAAFLGPQLTPQEVVTLPTDSRGNFVAPSVVVPVFAQNGTTQVGTFTIQGGQESPAPATG
jgi:hypothetical protein